MGSNYLAQYGAGDETRIRRRRLIVWSVAAIFIALGMGYLVLRDLREKQAAKHFLAAVNGRDYHAAYGLFCTASHPCPNYDYNRFLRDWGPSSHATAAWDVSSTDSCTYFVTVNVDAPGAEMQSLAVQRSDLSLSYAPAAECQEKKWRFRQFWDRLTGKAPKQGG